jgi:hypothetical protein
MVSPALLPSLLGALCVTGPTSRPRQAVFNFCDSFSSVEKLREELPELYMV